MNTKKIIGVFLFLIAASANTFFILPSFISRLDAISSNPNPLIRHFAPTWRSLKKIVDIPYLVAGTVRKEDSLPRYEIELTKNDLSNLLLNLPNYPEENRLYESYKQDVKGTFRFGDYETTNAKIRYRGVSPNHWNALKKSIQVNLPAENPLRERTVLRFFIGEDKGWVKGFLWNHLAEKLNLMSPKIEAVELTINKKPMGVYMLVEGWEESFLERYKKPKGRLFANKNLPITKPDLFRPESASLWYDRFEEERDGKTIPELSYFLWLIANAPDDLFAKEIEYILDMDTFLRWSLATILSGNFHQGNEANLNFYFNPATGKFEPIFFDASPSLIENTIELKGNRLVNRMLREKRFRDMFEDLAASYVNDSSNLDDDLAFYDAMRTSLLPAISRDSTKIKTTWEARASIANEREIYRHNFLALRQFLEEQKNLPFAFADETYPLSDLASEKSFDSFRAQGASRADFLKRYPQFTAGADPHIIILLPGDSIFTRDVIIPHNLEVIIREGANLYFASGVSLISYSPLTAIGAPAAPITMQPLIRGNPWGVVAVINAPKESVFIHTLFREGKDATINGFYLSGVLSLHNSDGIMRKSAITHAGADDGLHVLGGKAVIEDNFFSENSADHVDFDFAKEGSRILRNRFTLSKTIASDKNGDAIDLSFSATPVSENRVDNCSDKGVSIGEASTPLIEHNTIKGCAYGIAVKDRSEATIANNTFEQNEIAIGLYRKKPHFISGGTALLIENTFIDNKQDVFVDEYSAVK